LKNTPADILLFGLREALFEGDGGMKQRWIILWSLAVWMFLAAAGNSAFAGQIIYVDADANGLNDGTSWMDAYRFLQDALADANSSTKPIEIWVAQGTYRPDEDTLHPGGTGNREATFQLISGVTLKGGYAGFGEPDPNERNTGLYINTLSGDLNSNDGPEFANNTENSYHVVTASYTDTNAILDGFTITAGNANGQGHPIYQNDGGGMYNYKSSPNVNNCTFIENSAILGGGMFNSRYSKPSVNDCKFTKNLANDRGGGMFNHYSSPTVNKCTFSNNSANDGSGMVNEFSRLTVNNCTFSANLAKNYGGGMYNLASRPTANNCTFTKNLANGGGGMYNQYSSPIVNSCTFTKNSASIGGGIYNYYRSNPLVTNCTIVDNSGPNGPSMACDSELQEYPSTVIMVNCIIWNGLNWLWNNDNSTITVTYSDVQGGWPGEGNIGADPCFADVNNVDYHLKSQAGRWDADEGRWTKDETTSLCIDAGDPASPVGLEPFPNGGIINMGAYGGTAEASKSYFGETVCETIVAGDINGDCNVDFWDFAIMAGHWLEVPAPALEVKFTEVKIIKGELVEGRFKEIEEVDKLIVGDVFLIKVKVMNFRHETVNVLNLYVWDLSPQDYVEVIGSDSGCATYYELEPGESAFLRPFCITHAFKAEQNGWVTMNIYVRDWVSSILCEYIFTFEIVSSE
jgi:hypothetical protein